jgi:hypothetical protein
MPPPQGTVAFSVVFPGWRSGGHGKTEQVAGLSVSQLARRRAGPRANCLDAEVGKQRGEQRTLQGATVRCRGCKAELEQLAQLVVRRRQRHWAEPRRLSARCGAGGSRRCSRRDSVQGPLTAFPRGEAADSNGASSEPFRALPGAAPMEDPAEMQPRPEAPSRVTALPAAPPAMLLETGREQSVR